MTNWRLLFRRMRSASPRGSGWVRWADDKLMVDDSSKEESPCDPVTEEEIDETLKESFPASDPPSWTLGVENPCDEPANNEQPVEAPARNSS